MIFLLQSDALLHADEGDRRSGAQDAEPHWWQDGCVCRSPHRTRRRSDAGQDAAGLTEPSRVRWTGTCLEVGSRGETKKGVSPGSSLRENRSFRIPPDRPGRIAARSPAPFVRNSAEAMSAGANAAGPKRREQSTLEQRPGGRSDQSAEDAETPDVWSREHRSAQGTPRHGIIISKVHQL